MKLPVRGKYRIRPHDGNSEDISTPIGTPVYAPVGGVITKRGFVTRKDGSPSYGNVVYLQGDDGILHILAHLDKFGDVSEGQRVAPDTVLAYTGNSGRSTGPHLHYERRSGKRNVKPAKGFTIPDFEFEVRKEFGVDNMPDFDNYDIPDFEAEVRQEFSVDDIPDFEAEVRQEFSNGVK